MRVLLECEGQDALNQIIKNAVFNARIKQLTTFIDADFGDSQVEKDISNWHIRPGVDAISKIFLNYNKSFSGPILTTNFDPIIEIAIRRNGGLPQSVFLSNDGSFDNVHSDNDRNIVHLHGYWHGTDTLHTSEQITRSRPQLRGCLRKLLNDKMLLIVGYGGWDDSFTNTLVDLVSEGGQNYNIAWTFFDENEDDIRSKYEKILTKLLLSIGQRVVLYKGIDCDKFFPKLYDRLNSKKTEIQTYPDKNIDTNDTKIEVKIKKTNIFSCGTPPSNRNWFGRSDELNCLAEGNYKTIFITGIGGQGKSSLASEYIKSIDKSSDWEYWDWRDLKEEYNIIQTVIISMIERLTNGKIRSFNLSEYNIKDLVDLFFEELGEKKIVFTLDNVDKYIDLETFMPSRGLGILFQQALNRDHNCKFIFTCRPMIDCNSGNFLQIKLTGLSIKETEGFFKKYNIPMSSKEIESLIIEAHELTGGHPLYLNLIVAQAIRGKSTIYKFIGDIKRSINGNVESSLLADKTLKTVWDTLNDKQKILLRGMSETIRAETDDTLSKILEGELNYNQFRRSMNTLKALNLIVIKSLPGEPDFFELHPLVKKFVRYNNTSKDRSKYITLFVNYFNQIIIVLKPKLSANSPLSFFENWTNKIELEINKNDFKSALVSLQEIYEPIQTAGYMEEYIRVAHLFFLNCNWLDAINNELKYFHEQFVEFVKSLIEFGRFDESDNFLKKYSNSISGKGVHYIQYCDLRCYFYWHKSDYANAILWGEKGSDLKNNAGIEVKCDCDHNLALALRDSQNPTNIQKALSTFLKGEEIDCIYSSEKLDKHASFYGNIGRCLFFLGDHRAELYLKKSLSLLFYESLSNTILNIGFACKWIGDLFANNIESDDSFYFYSMAIINWSKISPYRAEELKDVIRVVYSSRHNYNYLLDRKELEIEKYCKAWIGNI